MTSAFDRQAQERVHAIASGIAEATGLEIVLVEFLRGGGRMVIRFTIDQPGGITLDDCAAFSRQVGAALEAEDPVPGSYVLEVSSPGLDRRLVKTADYERFKGKPAKITLSAPLEGRRRFQGTLCGVEDGLVLLETEEGQVFRLAFDAIEKAHLVPEF